MGLRFMPNKIETIRDLYRLPTFFYLFSYGSNNVKLLSERLDFPTYDLKIFRKIINYYTFDYVLENYQRTFFGISDPKGNGGGGAVGTLKKVDGCYVEGICLPLTCHNGVFYLEKVEVNLYKLAKAEMMDPISSINSKYILKRVGLNIYAFVKNDNYIRDTLKYHQVSKKYIELIGKTIMDCRRKREDNINKNIAEILKSFQNSNNIEIQLVDDNDGSYKVDGSPH